MRPLLEKILKTGLADGNSIPLDHNVSVPIGEFLQRIVRKVKPCTTLEIGLCYGISTLFIREALGPTCRHIVIDPYQHRDWHGIGLANLSRAGYEVEFYEDKSQIILPRLWADGLTIDFAFIDGWHTFDYALVDFFYVDRMLRRGGVVVFDNGDWPSIHKVCRFILTNRSYGVYAADEDVPYRGGRIVAPLLRAIPWFRRHLKPESRETDRMLGLPQSRCVAFVKQADDARDTDFHREF